MLAIDADIARRLLIEWQHYLRLSDWDITIEIKPRYKIIGHVRWRYKYKTADMTICSFDTIPKTFVGNRDPEVTIVHELLHIQYARVSDSIIDSSVEDIEFENSIEFTAQALVNLKRRAEKAEKKMSETGRSKT